MSLQSRQKKYIKDRVKVDDNGCWIWQQSLTMFGYGNSHFNYKQSKAHRVAYEAFIGPIPDGLHVCHTCDVRSCCNPEHFWVGTNLENHQDCNRKGRDRTSRNRGTTHWKARLTEDDVRAIRSDVRLQRIIAEEYGITQVQVSSIKLRKAWSHLE